MIPSPRAQIDDLCPWERAGPARSVSTVRHTSRVLVGALALTGLIASCGNGPSAADLEAVDYAPQAAEGWTVSTPAEHGLDPDAVAELYWRAGQLDSIYSLLVVKDGALVGEEYYHVGHPEQLALMQSAAKSITGALVGIAIEDGCLPSVDEPMMTYFPELADRLEGLGVVVDGLLDVFGDESSAGRIGNVKLALEEKTVLRWHPHSRIFDVTLIVTLHSFSTGRTKIFQLVYRNRVATAIIVTVLHVFDEPIVNCIGSSQLASSV